MFTSLDPFSSQTTDPLAGLNSFTGSGLGAANTNPMGDQFQGLLIQLLTTLIKRLEAGNSPLGQPASSSLTGYAAPSQGQPAQARPSVANPAAASQATAPIWVLPGPAATLSPATVAQAYAPVPPVTSAATAATAATNATTLGPTMTLAEIAAASAAANNAAAAATTVNNASNASTAATAANSASTTTAAATAASAASADPTAVMAIGDFPHPPDDNGRGMHWIPTVSSSPEVVDKFVAQLKAMHVKWVTLLNDGTNNSSNDYLVKQLTANGMEPVMRVYTSNVQPIDGDLGGLVRHYKALGVSYFQLFNEPNVKAENNGQTPDVNRYLDAWLPAAKVVADNGGYPGFGALSPGGEYKDTAFLSDALDQIQARGQTSVLNHAWLDIHNYQGNRELSDPDGFSRYKVYADILQQKLGRLMPMVGTEGGTFTDNSTNEAQRVGLVTDTYRYMENREPYNFAYSYWVIANQAGGGHDSAWEWQALIHPDGQSPLVDALDNLA